ncbi:MULTISPECIES: hypothetical protein [Clostridia]|uniref:Uncharacterized protein n=2 Tax=Clostridia TaxID=186801 RepID=A0A0P8WYJ3_9CLOT|nr:MULTISPECIES: hypothetical protein [Clostridia]KPU43469.1 hypothetical protein OXPF_29100 [Oxobacter pfennigii]WAJ25177.1 hypothetical protein OW255_06620 [Lacrimispora xylanolytica]
MGKKEVTNQNNFKEKKDASFERCVDFMARMIEKYGQETEQDRNKIAS